MTLCCNQVNNEDMIESMSLFDPRMSDVNDLNEDEDDENIKDNNEDMDESMSLLDPRMSDY